ncbi:MAG: DegT/DnrJ/EryC1/StrS family aminotransferase [Sediminibacterium sp. Gen4]|uniref:DegT/DnrJ/EryC1/StrS family aminotransferase n=1 Tax=unclassified Sediminibacterium TaxID=2635961 RepID=UPI0015B79503|nr:MULTISPECIES: DegT/DnrJ/EryC1/StrS family aminotransferase [unclassified Sediminibacterium]MBW0161325.1 DegT/DnrJ/EryC1/StrS family aminotransferase [Sediminibacterium sp.]MBW0163191.1 DegT/DnrJ/EryC1/StrS family aminotransferase [Sediminibacterium sp.]NWK65324.1 DegT/DnrJ/EryC1/StrS family aminotransferase [Sediminibacterium sp. Gen4]
MPGFELFGAEERKEVNDVLETGILMRYGFDGPRKGIWKAQELEKAITEVFGCQYAHLTSSGTAALTTAMAALNIGAGDEVIMPSFTFVASFEAVLSVGAVPVLVDVDETLTLSPAAVKAAITSKTKCVMPVHMCGSMADLDALKTICTEHNLILLEDACQSIGGTYKGKALGTIGHAGTFSFDFVKTITCGEGGVVMTNSEEVWTKCDGYTDHGHDHKGVDRGADLHPFIGYNFRISELHAAVGLAQIRKLDTFLSLQRKHNKALRAYLETIPEVSFRKVPDEAGDSCSFLSWFLPTEALTKAVIAEMKEQGILAGNFYWYANNWHYISKWDHLKNATTLNKLSDVQQNALLKLKETSFAASDAVMSRCISTAISLLWTEEQIKEKGEKMVAVIKKVLTNATVNA